MHLLAEPTKLELLQKEYEKKKDQIKNNIKGDVLKRYGGEEHLEAPPKTLLLAQTEDYVEYSRSGKVVKGAEKQVIRSKYEEDVYINNHTSVWGSFWKDGQWGYKCCHSFIKVRNWICYRKLLNHKPSSGAVKFMSSISSFLSLLLNEKIWNRIQIKGERGHFLILQNSAIFIVTNF